MIALFLVESEATSYVDQCNNILGLPKPGIPETPYPYGWTLTWADVTQDVNSKFPVPVCELVPVPDGVEVVITEEIFI